MNNTWNEHDFFKIECETDTNQPYCYTCTCKICGYQFERIYQSGEAQTYDQECVDHIMKYHREAVIGYNRFDSCVSEEDDDNELSIEQLEELYELCKKLKLKPIKVDGKECYELHSKNIILYFRKVKNNERCR